MSRRILLPHIPQGSIGFIVIASFTAVPCAIGLQDVAPPTAQTVQAPARPAAFGGIWKFNKELSSDTSKLQTQAENAAASTDGGGAKRRRGSAGFGGHGGGGGRGGGTSGSGSSSAALQTRALMREMADAPAQLTIVVTDTSSTMTDDQGVVHKFTTDGKKEAIDLGSAQVDGVSKWDGGTLTVELTGGAFKLTETYQLTVQGHALVEELKGTGSASGRNGGAGASAVPVKRIFDKADAGG
jgi:hypothetical protein